MRCSALEIFSFPAAAQGCEDNVVRGDEYIARGFNIFNTGAVAKNRAVY